MLLYNVKNHLLPFLLIFLWVFHSNKRIQNQRVISRLLSKTIVINKSIVMQFDTFWCKLPIRTDIIISLVPSIMWFRFLIIIRQYETKAHVLKVPVWFIANHDQCRYLNLLLVPVPWHQYRNWWNLYKEPIIVGPPTASWPSRQFNLKFV